jgi:lipoprotein-anchoring transpeptidase ErfK/SrfK
MKDVILGVSLAVLIIWATDAGAIESGTEVSPQNPKLQAGDYVWQPDVAPTGPVVIVVDLSKQVLKVFRNGVQIGRSTISSGKDSHPTPPGIFTILQKKVTHHSNIYHEASMPYMERLTWDGLAIHAGNLPGFPESHGCVHVPMQFAKKLYGVTRRPEPRQPKPTSYSRR